MAAAPVSAAQTVAAMAQPVGPWPEPEPEPEPELESEPTLTAMKSTIATRRIWGDSSLDESTPVAVDDEVVERVNGANNLQELVMVLMQADPSIESVKALKSRIESLQNVAAARLNFQYAPKDLKPKSLAKLMGKQPKGQQPAAKSLTIAMLT